MLSKISKLVIEFDPLKLSSKSAKELLARVSSPKATASNPDCQVEAVVKHQGPSFIDVEFTNKHRERIAASKYTAQQLIQRIEERSQVLEAEEVLQKASMGDLRLEVGSGSDTHKVGISRRVPIT